MKAKHIYRYFLIYRQYLLNNKLDDDSSSITVKNLVNFVDNEITDEDRADLADQIWN